MTFSITTLSTLDKLRTFVLDIVMLNVHMLSSYSECRSAACQHTECRGTVFWVKYLNEKKLEKLIFEDHG